MLRVIQPQWPGALQGFIALHHQFLVFLATDLVHRLAQVLADMKFVMHDVRLGNRLLDRLDKRLPHVHGHRFDGLLLLQAERLPQLIGGLCRPLFHYVQHPRLLPIRQQRDV